MTALYIAAFLAAAYVVAGFICSTVDRCSEPPGFYRTPTGSVVQFLITAAMWPWWLAEALSIRM